MSSVRADEIAVTWLAVLRKYSCVEFPRRAPEYSADDRSSIRTGYGVITQAQVTGEFLITELLYEINKL